MDSCQSFGWDKVTFLHSGSYDTVSWIFDENSGNSDIFS